MPGGLAHLLTASRVVIGALALSAALDGRFRDAAALITLSAVIDGLDGKLARWLNASSPFGGIFDYFCDYLCFLMAPWALTRGLLGPERRRACRCRADPAARNGGGSLCPQ
jgi:CDP-diacylglycerol--serine O-phosphatidyltransferase